MKALKLVEIMALKLGLDSVTGIDGDFQEIFISSPGEEGERKSFRKDYLNRLKAYDLSAKDLYVIGATIEELKTLGFTPEEVNSFHAIGGEFVF